MPRAFDITATTSSVQLGASGQGEVSFTVSNKLGTGVTVRATVEPVGNTRSEWMRFPDGMERTLSSDGTAVISVRVAVPPGTPPGTYSFNLVVASVSNPDEHYDRSPTVAFTVAAAPVAAKKPFPWWIVALAAGVLVIVGVVVAALSFHGEKGGLGQACAKNDPKCRPDLTCGTNNICLGAKGFKGCTKGEQCATNRCEEGTCEDLVALSGACNSADDCTPPLACHEGVCRGVAGFQGCDKAEQCVTGRCEAGTCQEQLTLGDTCNSADDCRSPLTCFQSFCLIPVGEKCTHPSQCVSGICQDQVCTRAVVLCPRCPLGMICVNGSCQVPVIRRDHRILQELQLEPRRTIPTP